MLALKGKIMEIENLVGYICYKYELLRHADRGIFFKLPKKKRKDISKMEDVELHVEIKNEEYIIVNYKGQKIFFVIGSNDFMDWIMNLMFRFKIVPYNGNNKKLKVHKGFYKAYQLLRPTVHQYLKDNPTEKLIIMGQSHGASVATLMGVDVQYNFPEIDLDVVLSGSPRTGNQIFVDSYNRRVPNTMSFKYGNDPVTNVPFKCMGFRHVSKLIAVGTKTKCFLLRIKDHMIDKKKVGEYLKWYPEV